MAIEITRSRRAIVVLAALAAVGAATCVLLPPASTASASLAVGALLVALWRGWQLVGAGNVTAFVWSGDGRWRIRSRTGAWQDVELMHSTTIGNRLLLLAWRAGRWRRSYALLDADFVERRAWCTLEGRLRLEAHRAPAA